MKAMDFENASLIERHNALLEILDNPIEGKLDQGSNIPSYNIKWVKIRWEDFPDKPSKGSSLAKVYRQYWVVSITNNKTNYTSSFEYFGPEYETKRGFLSVPVVKDMERLISFFSCIVSDFSVIEHDNIRDGFELMAEFGYEDPIKARDRFNSLLENHRKIKALFPTITWSQIEKIVEGY